MLHDLSVRPVFSSIKVILTTGVVAAAVGCAWLAAAHPPPPRTEPLRLYLLDAGTLTVNPTRFGLTKEEVTTDKLSVLSYLVVHPRGTLLWDTGVVPDSLIGSDSPGANRATRTLESQLAEIGYVPANITYLALSHLHSDHSANANDYAGSTWLVNKAERDAMFGETPYPSVNIPALYSALRNAKTVLIEGDHDVFGDGLVVIKPTPGHTPGHQVLFLNLAQTGPVVLSGDLYHYPEQRALNRFTVFDFDQNQTRASREALEAFLERTGTDLWIQHDINANAKRRKSPAYYE